MQLRIPTKLSVTNSTVFPCNNLEEIINKSKSMKSSFILVVDNILYGTNDTGFIISTCRLNEYVPVPFAFSTHKLGSNQVKEFLRNSDDGFIISTELDGVIIPNKYYDIIRSSKLINIEDDNLVEQCTGTVIPHIRINKFDEQAEFLPIICNLYNQSSSSIYRFEIQSPDFVVNNFETDEQFLSMIGESTKEGTRNIKILSPDGYVVITLYKGMIPYKMKDKISIHCIWNDESRSSFLVRFIIERKNFSCSIYANYLNIVPTNKIDSGI